MIGSKYGRSRWTAPLALGLAGAMFAGVPACKSRSDKSTPAASPSGSGAAAAAAGPCEQYAAKICEKAGAESATCQSFKTSADLMSPATCTAGIKDIAFSTTKLTSLRSNCDTLVKKLCDAIGPTTKTCEMVTTQTKQFPPERCKMMLENIPQILPDLQKMEAANKPLTPELQAAMADPKAPSFGPADAKVTIVEFSDFECPFCSRAAATAHQIREKYGDKVRFVFRQFPLAMHANARVAAEASLAAHEQGKFWEFHDKMFENQKALDRASLENQAKQTGLNVAEFKKSLDEKKYASQVEADLKLGEQVSVQGTPTMFLNGARVENPTDFAAISGLIDAALKSGTPG